MYELIKSNDELRGKKEIVFETNKKGALVLYNEIKEEDAVYIEAPAPVYYQINLTATEAANALGIDESIISRQYPMSLIDAGLRTLIVPIASLEYEIDIFPCEKTLKAFCIDNEIDIILIFSMDASNSEFISHTRVFAPKFGYLEDPATGSGNSAFGYYMYENKLWNGDCISLEQGGNDRIYNTVKLKMKDNKVMFGGKATNRIDGYYIIY
jgi:PhzF family phenazine biosynthesis protein